MTDDTKALLVGAGVFAAWYWWKSRPVVVQAPAPVPMPIYGGMLNPVTQYGLSQDGITDPPAYAPELPPVPVNNPVAPSLPPPPQTAPQVPDTVPPKDPLQDFIAPVQQVTDPYKSTGTMSYGSALLQRGAVKRTTFI